MARAFDLPETKGHFQLIGEVLGVEGKKFFEEKLVKGDKKMRFLKFGLKTSEENNVYVDLNGMERDVVYYSKRNPDTKKMETKKVKWSDRKTPPSKDHKIIGVNVGLEQYIDEMGKKQNKKMSMAEFDATEYLASHLKDDMPLFVKGKLEFSSFLNDKDEIARFVKFIPNQVSRLKSEVDFEKEDFKPMHDFTQTIIYMDAVLDDTDENDKKGVIEAKIVTWNGIEDASFIVRNQALFKTMKKNLKPYEAITVWGDIINKVLKEEVSSGDVWGEENPMERTGKTYVRELVITGANETSIDKETYTKANVEEAIRAINDFGGVGDKTDKAEDWGNKPESNNSKDTSNESEDEDDVPWDDEEW